MPAISNQFRNALRTKEKIVFLLSDFVFLENGRKSAVSSSNNDQLRLNMEKQEVTMNRNKKGVGEGEVEGEGGKGFGVR